MFAYWEIVRNLEEKYLRASTELGRAKESEVREKLKERFGFEYGRPTYKVFYGIIDEVEVYDYALSPEEIAQEVGH